MLRLIFARRAYRRGARVIMTIRLLLIDGDAVFDHVGVQLTRAGDFTVTAPADGRTAAASGHDAAVLDAGRRRPVRPRYAPIGGRRKPFR